MTTSRTKKKLGLVTFVGGGPGDPGLLTIRAVEALAEADVLVVDRASRETALTHCRADIEIVDPSRLPPAR